MAVAAKHAFVSAKADEGDASLVRPSDWNADHAVQLIGPALVGRVGASPAGPAEEVAPGSGLTLMANTLLDRSGADNHGTLGGTVLPALAAGAAGYGQALSFDGVQRGSIAANQKASFPAALIPTSGAFTVECYFTPGRNNVKQTIFSLGWDNTVKSAFRVGMTAAGALEYSNVTSSTITNATTSGVLAVGTRYHLALNVNAFNGLHAVFLNGVSVFSTTDSVIPLSAVANPAAVQLGLDSVVAENGNPFMGVIDEFRISHVARYPGTTSFTPATAPFVADTNTRLLASLDHSAALLAPHRARILTAARGFVSSTAEQIIARWIIPAYMLSNVLDSFVVRTGVKCAGAGAFTYRLRVGGLGTTGDAQAAILTTSAAQANGAFHTVQFQAGLNAALTSLQANGFATAQAATLGTVTNTASTAITVDPTRPLHVSITCLTATAQVAQVIGPALLLGGE